MNRKEFTENLTKAAGLQYDVWRKFPKYVHMDITLSTDYDTTKEKVKYNIYTPEINHNNYYEFSDFVRFLDSLIKDGVLNVNIRLLKTKLAAAQERRVDAIDIIAETKAKLEKLGAIGE